MVYGNIKDVFLSIIGTWILYVGLIEWIPELGMDWMLS
jgi:hypothetical protein